MHNFLFPYLSFCLFPEPYLCVCVHWAIALRRHTVDSCHIGHFQRRGKSRKFNLLRLSAGQVVSAANLRHQRCGQNDGALSFQHDEHRWHHHSAALGFPLGKRFDEQSDKRNKSDQRWLVLNANCRRHHHRFHHNDVSASEMVGLCRTMVFPGKTEKRNKNAGNWNGKLRSEWGRQAVCLDGWRMLIKDLLTVLLANTGLPNGMSVESSWYYLIPIWNTVKMSG